MTHLQPALGETLEEGSGPPASPGGRGISEVHSREGKVVNPSAEMNPGGRRDVVCMTLSQYASSEKERLTSWTVPVLFILYGGL